MPTRGLRRSLGVRIPPRTTHLLEALADPTHPEHRDLTGWLGAPFEPEAFDPADFVERLREGRLGAIDG
jgi:hypothetical protein